MTRILCSAIVRQIVRDVCQVSREILNATRNLVRTSLQAVPLWIPRAFPSGQMGRQVRASCRNDHFRFVQLHAVLKESILRSRVIQTVSKILIHVGRFTEVCFRFAFLPRTLYQQAIGANRTPRLALFNRVLVLWILETSGGIERRGFYRSSFLNRWLG